MQDFIKRHREIFKPVKIEDNPARARMERLELENYLILKNISCADADGKKFEHYDELHIAKDIVRNPDNSHKSFTPYQAALHFEKQGNGLFLPSFALSCNILVALYQNNNDEEVKKVMQQYKDYSPYCGWHAQNTVVNGGSKQIIHYPSDSDFPNHGGNDNINQRLREELTFNSNKFSNLTLEKALQISNFNKFIRNLTGLKNPEILIEIGDYFGETAMVWISSSNETHAAWLGGSGSYFDLMMHADVYLIVRYAARGVRAK